jgi:integrase
LTKNEINFAANYIAKLALEDNGAEKVNLAIESLLSTCEKEANLSTPKNDDFQQVSSIIIFTQKEIQKMDKNFKNIIIANGLTAKVYTRKSGYYQTTYEIRFRSHGYNFSCTAKTIELLKAEFLQKTRPGELEKYKTAPGKRNKKRKDILAVYFNEWLSLKRGNIGEKEIKRFETNFNNLPENLRFKPIREIRAVDLNEILKDVQPRKYEELRTLFNGIFKYAMASGVVQTNPVALIQFKRAERQNRECLSKKEILSFLERIKDKKYNDIRQFAYILYFFGLRPCEVDEETHREGDFLIARNRKRKNGKIEYKKIPIPKQAKNLIDWDKPITADLHRLKINDIMKELLDGKTAYCLRHTFATICQQYVRPDIVDIWMGDSPTRLVGRVYTHFPDEFMLENMLNVEFPIK